MHADQLKPFADQRPRGHFGFGHITRAAALVEYGDHGHEHVEHGDVRGRGDERTGFRHMFDAPRLEFGAIAEYDVASGEQTVGRFWILRFDFRGVGFAWAGREIMGRVYKMMLLREFCDLLVAQRLHCRARRRFSFRCHGLHCATGRRYAWNRIGISFRS